MAFLEVVELPSGMFAVRSTGGNSLQPPSEFSTRAEAEEWLILHASTGNDGEIYKPGDGEGVA